MIAGGIDANGTSDLIFILVSVDKHLYKKVLENYWPGLLTKK
jgi:hypothetical protein